MFQALLTSYYLCNAAAAITLLDYSTVARCVLTYHSVKAHFLDEDELAALDADPLGFGGEHGKAAYLRFREWEQENPEVVAELKADAEERLNGVRAGF
jgi:hypothetical protein